MAAMITALSPFAFATPPSVPSYEYYLPCNKTGETVIKMKFSAYASATGQYEVEGCSGFAPTLHLKAGVEYTFDQNEETNWYHPVGFAFEPGGAHNSCGDEEECPEVEEGLQYYVSGDAVKNDESGIGLDAYEPIFFYPEEAWKETCGTATGGCKAKLIIPADTAKFYYFCHIHKYMSAEIIVEGAVPGARTPQYPELFIKAKEPSAFDRQCGSTNSEEFYHQHPSCKDKKFLCGHEGDATFNDCMFAADCQMHHDMAVKTSNSRLATFVRQMVPHHAQAVAHAKILQKFMTLTDADGDQEAFDEMTTIAKEIVNTQNAQLLTMQAWLDGYEEKHAKTELCY